MAIFFNGSLAPGNSYLPRSGVTVLTSDTGHLLS